MFGKKKNKENEAIKQNLVDVAFDNFLKEGEDYTVAARTEDAILVKKIARWAYFVVEGKNVQACFSIETDKGLFCFQVKGDNIIYVETDVCTAVYPNLKP